jgi:hypothetical protein
VADVDLKTALRQLMAFVFTLLSEKSMSPQALCQVTYWFAQLPGYIKALLPPLRCES